MKNILLLMIGVGLLVSGANSFAQDARRGLESYKLCAGCHGFKGEGNQLVNAPKLTGQNGWYMARQLAHFRDGVRGTVSGDTHGATMAQMAAGLKTEEDIADLIAHIATLPDKPAAATVQGDAANGKKLYMTCAACHGQKAEGNAATNAPALAGMDDWYQLAQLVKFKNGQRGANPNDTYGAQMAPMAGVLSNDQAMRDVVAYINSLKP